VKGLDVVEVLQKFGEIAHWTICPAFDIGNLSCPPIVAWRYKLPSSEVADFFQRAVCSYRSAISWRFSAAERMWTLMPTRIDEYSKSHGDIGGIAAAEALTSVDPAFGERANAELLSLFQHLQRECGEKGRKDVPMKVNSRRK
jgi:hypothetical protein